ncbi:unnamed protein product [Ambrosiozyma monospora]|uniref:Unnamed protein product n=1 Tax=Ambrosiozyma monospora TaxID=43982 RepID=A0ACB5T718_AMBMO|nr:unnamed protein product [Ambrosiozyma monospora]
MLPTHYLVEKPSIDILKIDLPLDSNGLKDLAQVSRLAGFNDLSLHCSEPLDSEDGVASLFTILIPDHVQHLSLYSEKFLPTNICFTNTSSLKKFEANNCTLSFECLNSLPNTLTSLKFYQVKLNKQFENSVLRLPEQLHELSIRGKFDNFGLYTGISNMSQLNELKTLSIVLLDNQSIGFGNSKNGLPYSLLKSFLHSLPESVKNLSLEIGCDLKESDENDIVLRPEHLSLNTLHHLNEFKFSCFSPSDNFDLSSLPSSLNIVLDNPFLTFAGEFSSRLEFLDIELFQYEESFENFWKRYISPLENLVHFQTVADGFKVIDFRELKFPPCIHTIKINFQNTGPIPLKFDELPDSLNEFSLNCCEDINAFEEFEEYFYEGYESEDIEDSYRDRLRTVDVKGKKGQSAESLKNIFNLYPGNRFKFSIKELGTDDDIDLNF